MTTPLQRSRAVIGLASEVGDMIWTHAGEGPSVLVDRERLIALRAWLEHFPLPDEIVRTARACPELWADPHSPAKP